MRDDDRVREMSIAMGWEGSVPDNVEDMPTDEQIERALVRQRQRDEQDREDAIHRRRLSMFGDPCMVSIDPAGPNADKTVMVVVGGNVVLPIFGGPIGKAMMIEQGYVPATCTLPDELAGPFVFAMMSEGKDPCIGCNSDRAVCRGRETRGEP